MVSVIIPVHNRITVLKDAIESVLCQTFKNFEIIIVDDGSTTDIATALKPYLNLIKYIRFEKNRGVSAARNEGIRLSKGEYIAFLDSDDIWLPFKLEKQISFMTQNGFEVCHTDEFWYKKGVFINQGEKHKKFGGKILTKILDHCRISPSSFIAKKEVFYKSGIFNESLPIAEDYDLWLRIALFYRIGFLNLKTIVKRFFLNDHLSHSVKNIEYYRLLALRKFYSKYKTHFNHEEKLKIIQMINRKEKIVASGLSKKTLKETNI
ncbi:glycosyltransferase family 2 protein [Deferribacter autotrophicus]|uniref:Glycosyltransferase family 2 protein n=1 Tax=Deferribacter autotrophicus TaxID=500465 RepID=A0A5A8F2I9_9BACT|nr:glycosyltransferase family A protein [Deferribacter autotrophicus]KAA0257684.1 glycosyltransferase family 2 protein [Deferribacter autotrophicus]